MLNHRVVLHARTAASSPRNDLVKNCRVHPTHWLISTQVVEQTYVGVAAREDRVTPLTSEIGVYAVLGFVAGPSVGALFAPLKLDYGRWRVDEFTAPGYFVGLLCVAMMVACYVTFNPSDAVWKSKSVASMAWRTMRRFSTNAL